MSFDSLEQSFYTGNYKAVIEADLDTISDVEENFKAHILQARARIVEGRAKEVSAELVASEDPVYKLIRVYADSVNGSTNSITEAAGIIETAPQNNFVKHLGGLIFARSGEYERALSLLRTHEGSLECVLLMVQILLMQQRVSEASTLVGETRKWANDHLLYNLAEAWTCLRQSKEQTQKAYYIFEELNGSHPTARTELGQGLSQLLLLRWPEAEESLLQAAALSPSSDDVAATSIALSLIQNQDPQEYRDQLSKTSEVALDVKEKSEFFDKIVQKYQAQVPRA